MGTRRAGSKAVHLEEVAPNTPAELRAQARELLLEYGRFVIAQPGTAQFCFGSLEKEAARLPFTYQEQGGGCMIAWANHVPAGFVAWRSLAASAQVVPDAWELKRLWVRPEARGLALGRALTQAVLDRALDARRKAVYLDTAPASMAAAYRVYLDMGFVPCPPYNSNPVEGLVYLVKYF
jgi:GNAT superfamily N-acetyltransferase